MEEINNKYRDLCVIMGDIEVKLKGLNNQKAQIFAQLEELDKAAAKIMQEKVEVKSET